MGMFLIRFSTALIFFLLLAEIIVCARNGTLSVSKSKKIKRDSSTLPFNFNNMNSFGHQKQYRRDYLDSTSERRYSPLTPLFNFPDGTKLSFTPQVSIPVTNDDNSEATTESALVLAFPLSVTFKKPDPRDSLQDHFLHKIDAWNIANTLSQHPVESNDIDQHQPRLLSRKLRAVHNTSVGSPISRVARKLWGKTIEKITINKRSGSSKSFGGWSCSEKSFSDRRTILQKIELLAGNFIGPADNSKACLLRWTCELHENSEFASYYGLIGEGVLLVFSFEEHSQHCDISNPNLKYVVPFIKAEIAGKSGKCVGYTKKCSKSLFAI